MDRTSDVDEGDMDAEYGFQPEENDEEEAEEEAAAHEGDMDDEDDHQPENDDEEQEAAAPEQEAAAPEQRPVARQPDYPPPLHLMLRSWALRAQRAEDLWDEQ